MKAKPKIGPTHDTAFFDDIQAVFEQHPNVAKNYAIGHIGEVVDVMGIDLDRQVGMSTVRDGELVTKYVDRRPEVPEDPGCIRWVWRGEWVCATYIVQAPPT
ncbi:hypothetical protein QFZ66_005954 [Streptomyces sp. B4I13]|uniref:hypothetical protein n=1 Tax=Streptomyces sp. B4I13 TaxID=3042271 RepID=UPI0027899047|nr:hypothetical protein [Streptomyces sp. B4I13]MDQ0962076.1 hypothetical protein [Streptomyces sp. B4I13]